MNSSNEPTTPSSAGKALPSIWYKEFWFWFLVSPLIVVFAVGTAYIYIAVSGADDVVVDDYYKKGKMINQHFDAENLARALGVSAVINFDREDRGSVGVSRASVSLVYASSSAQFPPHLVLLLSHPAERAQDMELHLARSSENNYSVTFPRKLTGRWYLRLQPKYHYENLEHDELTQGDLAEYPAWRLKGELEMRHQQRITLF